MTAIGARVLAVDNVGAGCPVIVRIGFPRCRDSFHTLKFGQQKPFTGFTHNGHLDLVYHANDALSRFVLQRVEGFVDNQPARLMQQDTSEDQALLLVIGEFPFPARDTVERRGKAIQACALERSYQFLVLISGVR